MNIKKQKIKYSICNISPRFCKTFILVLTLATTVIMSISRSYSSTYWDTSENAATGVTDILQSIVNHWWIPVFLVGLVIFVFGTEKTKSVGKYLMIGVFVIFVIANGTSVLESSVKALAEMFNGTSAANSGSGG